MSDLTEKGDLSDTDAMKTRNLVRAIIGFTMYLLLVQALLFIAAGTTNWPMAWVYVVLLLAATFGSRLIVWKKNPGLLRERARFTKAEGAKPWDRILVGIVGVYGPMAMMVVAGLDRRIGWAPVIPVIGQHLAAVAVAGGYGVAVWAMVVNPYFSAVARIQRDRGQVVVTEGPYAVVRHPSYAGALIVSLALPVMLDAMWAMAPALLVAVALIIRTMLEDAMLIEELDGYRAYAAEKTPCRLIPEIW